MTYQGPTFCGEIRDDLFLFYVDTYDKTSIIEEITMTSKCTVDDGSNLDQRRPLQDNATNEILLWGIVALRSIHKNWIAIDLRKCIHVNRVEVIDTIIRSGIPSGTVVRYVGFGEKICSVGGWIDDRGANDSDVVRNVRAANI